MRFEQKAYNRYFHYVAVSTRWRFLPYDLITIQNWCHLFGIIHYSTQFMCIEPF